MEAKKILERKKKYSSLTFGRYENGTNNVKYFKLYNNPKSFDLKSCSPLTRQIFENLNKGNGMILIPLVYCVTIANFRITVMR